MLELVQTPFRMVNLVESREYKDLELEYDVVIDDIMIQAVYGEIIESPIAITINDIIQKQIIIVK